MVAQASSWCVCGESGGGGLGVEAAREGCMHVQGESEVLEEKNGVRLPVLFSLFYSLFASVH